MLLPIIPKEGYYINRTLDIGWFLIRLVIALIRIKGFYCFLILSLFFHSLTEIQLDKMSIDILRIVKQAENDNDIFSLNYAAMSINI